MEPASHSFCSPQKKEKGSAKKLEEKHLDDHEVDHCIFTHHLLIISFLVFKASLLHGVDSTLGVNIKKQGKVKAFPTKYYHKATFEFC